MREKGERKKKEIMRVGKRSKKRGRKGRVQKDKERNRGKYKVREKEGE